MRQPAAEGDGFEPVHIGARNIRLRPPGLGEMWLAGFEALPPMGVVIALIGRDKGLILQLCDGVSGDIELGFCFGGDW